MSPKQSNGASGLDTGRPRPATSPFRTQPAHSPQRATSPSRHAAVGSAGSPRTTGAAFCYRGRPGRCPPRNANHALKKSNRGPLLPSLQTFSGSGAMRAAVVLAVLAGLLATGCLGGRSPEPEVVVVTATPSANTQEIQDGTAEPTLTWNQWLGQQIADGRCDNPDHIVAYENENRTPPYSAVSPAEHQRQPQMQLRHR